jgi:hypothetical protein
VYGQVQPATGSDTCVRWGCVDDTDDADPYGVAGTLATHHNSTLDAQSLDGDDFDGYANGAAVEAAYAGGGRVYTGTPGAVTLVDTDYNGGHKAIRWEPGDTAGFELTPTGLTAGDAIARVRLSIDDAWKTGMGVGEVFVLMRIDMVDSATAQPVHARVELRYDATDGVALWYAYDRNAPGGDTDLAPFSTATTLEHFLGSHKDVILRGVAYLDGSSQLFQLMGLTGGASASFGGIESGGQHVGGTAATTTVTKITICQGICQGRLTLYEREYADPKAVSNPYSYPGGMGTTY